MYRSIVKKIIIAMALSACATIPVAAIAAETEAHVAIPSNSAGIWQAIDSNLQQLHGAITQNRLNTVHEHAYAVRDLVRALPSRSPNLTAEALAIVRMQSSFVDTLATRLDQTGDAHDKAGTESNLNKLESVLKTIRAQYPVPAH